MTYSATLVVKPVGAKRPLQFLAEGRTDAQAVEAVRKLAKDAIATISPRDVLLTVRHESDPEPVYITTLLKYEIDTAGPQ
jgi:hypothetical protein